MNVEDRFAAEDPARELPPLTADAKREIAVAAMEGHVTLELPVSGRRGRQLIAVAAVAALVVGFGLFRTGPLANHGPARLVLSAAGQGTPSYATGGGAGVEATGKADKMMSSAMMPWFGAYQFVSDIELSDAADTGTAYSVTALPDSRAIAEQIRNYFELPEFVKQDMQVVPMGRAADAAPAIDYLQAIEGEGADQRSLYVQVGERSSWNYFGYYNSKIDPWHDCNLLWQSVKSDPTTGETTNPDAVTAATECKPAEQRNLPSDSSAKSQLQQLLSKFGISTAKLKYTIYADEYSYQKAVNAELLVEGTSVASWSASFVDAGLLSFGGSLTEVNSAGDYDLLSPKAALERLNSINAKQRDAWAANQPTDQPTATDGSGEAGTSGDGTVTTGGAASGSDGSVDPGIAPEPVPTDAVTAAPLPGPGPQAPQVVHVTRVERVLLFASDQSGSGIWVPGYSFYGYVEGGDQQAMEFPYGQVIAVVDSQFDVAAYYSNWLGGIIAY